MVVIQIGGKGWRETADWVFASGETKNREMGVDGGAGIGKESVEGEREGVVGRQTTQGEGWLLVGAEQREG